ncbi:MAG: ribonuclease R, partial [Pseudomonadota bacterium]
MAKIPSRADVLDWISENPTRASKRDIAKAFGIKGADRIELKRLLKALEDDGHLEKRKRSYRDPDSLPPVSVLMVTGPDRDGDLMAKPMEWNGEGPEPRVLLIPRAGDPALGEGDRILARLQEVKGEDHHYQGRLIRRIGTNPRRILGVFRKGAEGGRIVPIDKKANLEWLVPAGATGGAKDYDVSMTPAREAFRRLTAE